MNIGFLVGVKLRNTNSQSHNLLLISLSDHKYHDTQLCKHEQMHAQIPLISADSHAEMCENTAN